MTAPASPSLTQIRDAAQALLTQGKPDETWTFLLAALEAVLAQNRELELLVLKLRRERLGRHTERLDPRQIALLFDTLVAQEASPTAVDPEAEAEEDAALDREIAEAERAAGPRRRRKRRKTAPGWQTTGVERQVHVIEVPVTDQTCVTCQQIMPSIGVDVTRRLAYVPGYFVEHETHRQKVACPRCKDRVVTAPAPAQVLPRSAADPSVLAHIVVSKFADHTPLHRLHRIYARSGADIPVSTLADWVAGVGALVEPLIDRLAARVHAAFLVRTDATGLKVLDRRSADHIELGSIWAYVGDDRDVLFRYTPTGEGATGPWAFLAGRRGYVQADAATVFDRLFTGQVAQAVEVGCLAHGRRRLIALQAHGLSRRLSPETDRATLSAGTPRRRPRCDARGSHGVSSGARGSGARNTPHVVRPDAGPGAAGDRSREGGGLFHQPLACAVSLRGRRPPRSRQQPLRSPVARHRAGAEELPLQRIP